MVRIAAANSSGTVAAWYVWPSVLPVVFAVGAIFVTVVSTLESSFDIRFKRLKCVLVCRIPLLPTRIA
jgi:hypothetical protein